MIKWVFNVDDVLRADMQALVPVIDVCSSFVVFGSSVIERAGLTKLGSRGEYTVTESRTPNR